MSTDEKWTSVYVERELIAQLKPTGWSVNRALKDWLAQKEQRTYQPLPVNPELIQEEKRGINLLPSPSPRKSRPKSEPNTTDPESPISRLPTPNDMKAFRGSK